MMQGKMKKLLILLIGIPVLIYTLASCSMGPDFQKPDVETPAQYKYDSLKVDSVTVLKWWDLFNDPVLDTLIVTALRENKNLLIAISRIEEARANLGFTGADRYPKLDIQGDASRSNLFSKSIGSSEINNSFFIGPVLSWEIDFWGKFRRATESARAQLLASEYSLRTIQISLISEVISTYFLLLDYKQRLETSINTLASRETSLNIIQERYNKGIVAEIDLNQSQIQKEIAAAAVPIFERLVAQTENALRILLGKLPGEIKQGNQLHDQIIPPDIPPGLPSDLLVRRPDIAEAEYLLMAQNANIGVAVAKMFPSISLTGILGLASNDLSTLTTGGSAWSISGGLLGPLFNFNKNTLRVEIEEARTEQAFYQYENTVLNAFREVEDALVEVETYKRQLAAKQRQFDAAKNAEYLSLQRYDQGVTSYLEVLESQRSAFDAELQLSEVKKNYLNAYVKLYKALGGGWITKEEMQEVENQTELE
jgi:outer membrane protein, multidrug efflux system